MLYISWTNKWITGGSGRLIWKHSRFLLYPHFHPSFPYCSTLFKPGGHLVPPVWHGRPFITDSTWQLQKSAAGDSCLAQPQVITVAIIPTLKYLFLFQTSLYITPSFLSFRSIFLDSFHLLFFNLGPCGLLFPTKWFPRFLPSSEYPPQLFHPSSPHTILVLIDF